MEGVAKTADWKKSGDFFDLQVIRCVSGGKGGVSRCAAMERKGAEPWTQRPAPGRQRPKQTVHDKIPDAVSLFFFRRFLKGQEAGL